jgi:hypothetical protein
MINIEHDAQYPAETCVRTDRHIAAAVNRTTVDFVSYCNKPADTRGDLLHLLQFPRYALSYMRGSAENINLLLGFRNRNCLT